MSKNPWAAASVVPGKDCCQAAKRIKGIRYLGNEAPKLPLRECSAPHACACHFQKHEDRRTGLDRRDLISTRFKRREWMGEEQRESSGRRLTDRMPMRRRVARSPALQAIVVAPPSGPVALAERLLKRFLEAVGGDTRERA
jgi:hypothetical protein